MELAAARAPAVVVYRANPVTELLARLLAAVR
jgi:lipid A disaccharide synthetase